MWTSLLTLSLAAASFTHSAEAGIARSAKRLISGSEHRHFSRDGPKMKKGLGMNVQLSLGPLEGKVGWATSWVGKRPEGMSAATQHVPMLWSPLVDAKSSWKADVEAGIAQGDTALLGFYSPFAACITDLGADPASQCFSDTAAGYKEHYTSLKDADSSLTLISPITSIVAPPNDGGISNAETKDLDQFFTACQDCKIDAVAFSWQGPRNAIEQFKRNVDEMSLHFSKPVWIIGFTFTDLSEEVDLVSEVRFMEEAIKFLDGNANVQGYAWDYTPLVWKLEDGTVGLSPFGKLYVGEPLS